MKPNESTDRTGTPVKGETARRLRQSLRGPSRAEFAAPRGPNGDIAPPLTHADIQLAAYLRWRQCGGDALGNWLACEREAGDRAPGAPGPAHAAPSVDRGT